MQLIEFHPHSRDLGATFSPEAFLAKSTGDPPRRVSIVMSAYQRLLSALDSASTAGQEATTLSGLNEFDNQPMVPYVLGAAIRSRVAQVSSNIPLHLVVLARQPYEVLTDGAQGSSLFTSELERISNDGVSVSWWYPQASTEDGVHGAIAMERAVTWSTLHPKRLSDASHRGFFSITSPEQLEISKISVNKDTWLAILTMARQRAALVVLDVLARLLQRFGQHDPCGWTLLALSLAEDFSRVSRAGGQQATIRAVLSSLSPAVPGWATEFHVQTGDSSWGNMRTSAVSLGVLKNTIGAEALAALGWIRASGTAFGLLIGQRQEDQDSAPEVIDGLRRSELVLRETRNRIIHPTTSKPGIASMMEAVVSAVLGWSSDLHEKSVARSLRSLDSVDVPTSHAWLLELDRSKAEQCAAQISSRLAIKTEGSGFFRLLTALSQVDPDAKSIDSVRELPIVKSLGSDSRLARERALKIVRYPSRA